MSLEQILKVALLIAAAWLAYSALISVISGWRELGERFRSDEPVEGERFRFQSVSLGWEWLPLNYGGCLFATVGPRGIALTMVLPLRFMHPRLMIPWSAIEECVTTRKWYMNYVAVRIVGYSSRLFLTGKLGEKVLETWSRAHGRS